MIQYNLAIIGNGFDLYYNQPTRYDDFYNVIKDINNCDLNEFLNKHSDKKI